MSADNWTTCPSCYAKAIAAHADLVEKTKAAYGKVSAEEYMEMAERSSKEPVIIDSTLREDYELGTSEYGRFGVSYRSSCGTCGYSFDFKHEQETNLKAQPKKKP